MRRKTWVLLVLGGLLALAVSWQPQDPHQIDLAEARGGVSWTHPLGADHLGRDMPARLMLGAKNTVVVLVTIGAISFVLGTGVGVAVALAGGVIEALTLLSRVRC